MKKFCFVFFLVVVICVSAFVTRLAEEKPVPIPPSKQRLGDAAKGLDYLITGDYLRSGIPYNAFLFGAGASNSNYLKREGLNQNLSHEYTAIKATNGEILVAPN